MFPRKRRTLEILARNVGSGGREATVETRGWAGRPPRLGGISFPWRLPANATLPPYRGRRRRHRRRRVCSCSCAPWFRFRFPPSAFTPAVPTVVSTRASTHASGRTESFRSLSPTFSFRFRSCHPLHPSAPGFSADGALPSNSSATPATPLTLLALLLLIVPSLMRLDRKRIV